MMHPSASSGTIVPIPPKAPTSQTMVRGNERPQQEDLLGQDTAVGPQGGSGAADDLMGLFDNMGFVSPTSAESNPFDAFAPVAPSPSAQLSSNAPALASTLGSLDFAQAPQQRTAPAVVNQKPTPVALGIAAAASNAVPAFAQVTQQPPQQQQPPMYGQVQQQQQRPAVPQQYAPNQSLPGHPNAGPQGPSAIPIPSQQYQQARGSNIQPLQSSPGTQYGTPQLFQGGVPQQQQGHQLQPGPMQAAPGDHMIQQQHQQQQHPQMYSGQQSAQTSGYAPQQRAPPPGSYIPQQQPGQSVPPSQPYPGQQSAPPQQYQQYQPQPAQQKNVSQFDPFAKR
jgi:hypothetical protein